MPAIVSKFKIQAPGGKATPAPPLGPTLGQRGINIPEFISRFNEMTRELTGDIIPVEVTLYEDRSFSLQLKTPPASELLKKAAGISKGSGTPNTAKVGSVTHAQIKAIAQRKMADLSARDLAAAVKIIEGTARSMGITIK